MSERGAQPQPQPPPAGMVVTEQQIAEALESFLRDANNGFSSLSDVVQQLESKLGVNLSHRIDFITAQIRHLYRLPPFPQNFVHHHQQQQDHFALHQTPNFQPAPTPHPNPNFAAQHAAAEGYGFRPPTPQPQSSRPQPQPQPQPSALPPSQLVGKSPSAPPPAGVPAKERWVFDMLSSFFLLLKK